jgi:hypothetical protein
VLAEIGKKLQEAKKKIVEITGGAIIKEAVEEGGEKPNSKKTFAELVENVLPTFQAYSSVFEKKLEFQKILTEEAVNDFIALEAKIKQELVALDPTTEAEKGKTRKEFLEKARELDKTIQSLEGRINKKEDAQS